MSYERRWLDEPHVGDHVGRSVWALGEILSTAWVPALVGPAQRLLDSLVGTLTGRDFAAHGAPMPCSVSPGSIPTASTGRRGSCSSAASSSSSDAYERRRPRVGSGSRTRSPTTTRDFRRR